MALQIVVDGVQRECTAEEELVILANIDADSEIRPVVLAEKIRKERDQKLVESDWTQVLDAQVDQAVWATYRQALRDVPAQAGFPNTIDWPTEP
tara:strand:+ start:1089 stop:1370 length:282 start_codon:yes stop_codon:yes gene_type:complete